ncbi:hypothetical protein KP509_22G071900 [Ceratopteris richardii]|uniref:ALOG domain-containing protein n=1 Tax=Ceratopteris richardii TaxID=49495 RepID=A0A8T2S881_CERRI|nr:hypothetical protein KP509_22G071900 [Ceratopteris richardii]
MNNTDRSHGRPSTGQSYFQDQYMSDALMMQQWHQNDNQLFTSEEIRSNRKCQSDEVENPWLGKSLIGGNGYMPYLSAKGDTASPHTVPYSIMIGERGTITGISGEPLFSSMSTTNVVPLFSRGASSSMQLGSEPVASTVTEGAIEVSDSARHPGSSSACGVRSVPTGTSSRYESQKRRDWNTFGQYLRNSRPPLTLARCNGEHVLLFLKYLDQFGKTKVHAQTCPFFGVSNPPDVCVCPLRQAWGSLDALIGRLRAAFEEHGGKPESNPFAARNVRLYLREVRETQGKARGIAYEKKKRKRPRLPSNLGSKGLASDVLPKNDRQLPSSI